MFSECAPAGNYVATMCVTDSTGDGGPEACPFGVIGTPKCVKVPFRFPDDAVVMGTITP
jgi:hypothetical protein